MKRIALTLSILLVAVLLFGCSGTFNPDSPNSISITANSSTVTLLRDSSGSDYATILDICSGILYKDELDCSFDGPAIELKTDNSTLTLTMCSDADCRFVAVGDTALKKVEYLKLSEDDEASLLTIINNLTA